MEILQGDGIERKSRRESHEKGGIKLGERSSLVRSVAPAMVCSRVAVAAGSRAAAPLPSRARPAQAARCPLATRRRTGLARLATAPENNPAASTAPASPSEGDLPLYTNFSDALEDWQLVLLEEAFRTSSRRKISVSHIARTTAAGGTSSARSYPTSSCPSGGPGAEGFGANFLALRYFDTANLSCVPALSD